MQMRRVLGLSAVAFFCTAVNGVTGQELTGQLTSVSQLSDVRTTDWAFNALQSLVERYNCIVGYPNLTYRGQRALTRYEFAAGLNACMEVIRELIANGLADKVSKEDLAVIERLQNEFSNELQVLRGRINNLEGKVAVLEQQQFSTTTKLSGQGIIALSSGTAQNAVMTGRVRLSLNTNFNERDLLVTELTAGNASTASSPYISYGSAVNELRLSSLRYSTQVNPSVMISAGVMRGLDMVDKNSYANNEAVDFSNKLFLNNQLILPVESGTGVFAKYSQGGFHLSTLYYGSNAAQASGSGGLFGESNQVTVELGYTAPQVGLKLQYTRASLDSNNLLGVPASLDSFGANLEWTFSRNAAMFGRIGFGTLQQNVPPNASLSPLYWTLGFVFPNLLQNGSLAGIGIGQPAASLAVPATQTNVELFYNYRVNNNLRITPDLQIIFNPNNTTSPTVFVGTLRTVFSF